MDHTKAIAFVDYDNVRLLRERTYSDVVSNIDELFDCMTSTLSSNIPAVQEIEVRLYGGWVCEDGKYSRIAEWAFAAVSVLRGRRRGMILKPSIITCAACHPKDILIGTVRSRSRPTRQKMVDSLMIVDAIYLSREPNCVLLLISDDDDFVPCALALCINRKEECRLLRKRPAGVGLNDSILMKNGVHLDVLRT